MNTDNSAIFHSVIPFLPTLQLANPSRHQRLDCESTVAITSSAAYHDDRRGAAPELGIAPPVMRWTATAKCRSIHQGWAVRPQQPPCRLLFHITGRHGPRHHIATIAVHGQPKTNVVAPHHWVNHRGRPRRPLLGHCSCPIMLWVQRLYNPMDATCLSLFLDFSLSRIHAKLCRCCRANHETHRTEILSLLATCRHLG